MSVVGPGTKLVFCEGKPDSLDAALLNELVTKANVLIVPAGGKQGLRAFIDGYLARYGNTPPQFIAFRDRDFDVRPSDIPALQALPGSKPVFASHCSCVESYLLEPEILHMYWLERSQDPDGRRGETPPVAEIAQWMEESAREIRDYQAVRWALAALKPGPRWPEVRTTWTEGSGHLPDSLAMDQCTENALALVTQYGDQTAGVNERALRERVEQFARQFESDSFWQQRLYRVWFHGKDLCKAMQRQRPNDISLRHFFQWAAKEADLLAHPDLKQLADKLN